MGNKHEELEIYSQLQGYDFVGNVETWYGSHDWSVALEGYGLFRKDRGRKMRRRRSCPLCKRAVGVLEALPGDGGAYVLGLKRGQAKGMLYWESAVGHLIRRSKWMRPSTDS